VCPIGHHNYILPSFFLLLPFQLVH
jgi:hypothetical protein